MNDLLNNPVLLAGLILGVILFFIITIAIVFIVKKHNNPENVEKRRIKKQLKQEALAKEYNNKNIDTLAFKNKTAPIVEDESVIKVHNKKTDLAAVLKITSKKGVKKDEGK